MVLLCSQIGLERSLRLWLDADCLAGLVALVEDIINGDLDDGASKSLLSSLLVMFLPFGLSLCLLLVQPSAAALLEPIQLAQSRGGCERPSIFCRRH